MSYLILIGIAVSASIATLIGGSVALQLKDRLHLILGFSAGAVLAVAFFDLLPESLELGQEFFSLSTLLTFTALGFFLYTVLDRFILLHTHTDGDEGVHDHMTVRPRGLLGALSLSLHSFLDGFAIGLAFQASTAVGVVVAVAVLVHDFSDGINTVNLIRKNGGSAKEAWKWLLIDAIAPVLGIGVTLFFVFPPALLSIVLATFAGFFLYIGASELLPESHHAHPRFMTTLMTLVGAGVLYVAITLAGH